MNRTQAIQLIQQTFEAPFERERYLRFLRELLNGFDSEGARVNQGARIPEKFQDYVEKMERLGKYVSGRSEVMLFIVHLKRETAIERARTLQRNFVAWYLQRDMKDAALAAFVSPNAEDWRFSLVKMEYRIEDGAKVREEFTPARRWSFLVGVNEKSHTAQSRFVPLLENDETPPTLAELEEAFNIERVTKEFFEKYRDLFVRTKEALDQAVAANPAARSDFEAKGVDTVNLAKKLLGQIVFLYYLQKKGWFGVPRDAAWGEGSKRFLRELFEKRHGEYQNFFNDILEPLFYEALRIDRSHDDHFYSRFNCKIPFLNGGLFDPLNGYDWVHTDLLLPNALFSNANKTREGDTGDGILDVFDRYNFTVKEDEPFEKEVAIDPELLGKAYEKFNAIRPDNYAAYLQALRRGKKGEESKFNKQYGVYYTPREIVHYMCQQSLIQYLYSEVSSSRFQGSGGESGEYSEEELARLGLPRRADIETLILRGEQIREHDEQVMAAGRETETYSFQMPEAIRKHAAQLDRALAEIKVCDPAAGSGAFPVGMMNEIVKARLALRIYQTSEVSETSEVLSAYAFKRACIENSLYGVDIDPGAVEIAKLRLWLSLVVDEDDPQNIKPLPNLDYKIVCGNSLLGVEKNLFNHALFAELERLKPLYFNETQPARKQQLKAQIDRLIDQLTNGRAQFDFEIYFSEVFHQKGGFDVVIGNPPYSAKQSTETKSLTKLFHHVEYKCDPYAFFVELGWKIVKKSGQLTYIIPVTWMTNYYYAKLRSLLIQTNSLKGIVLFEGLVFESANVDTCLLFAQKQAVLDRKFSWVITSPLMEKLIPREREYSSVEKEVRLDITPGFDSGWEALRQKLDQQSVRLDSISQISLGMKLRSNEAFVVETKDEKHPDPIYFGSDISYFGALKPSKFFNFQTADIIGGTKKPAIHAAKPKILIQAIRNLSLKRRIVASIDFDGYCFVGTVNSVVVKDKRYDVRFLLAILNSNLLNVYFRNRFTTISLTSAFLGVLPIKKISDIQADNSLKDISNTIVALVTRILAAKRADPQADTSELEREIDRLVYALYGLTEEEIKIVEG